jgi:hypothetical protein
MREYCTSGSVRGAPGNRRPYRGDGSNDCSGTPTSCGCRVLLLVAGAWVTWLALYAGNAPCADRRPCRSHGLHFPCSSQPAATGVVQPTVVLVVGGTAFLYFGVLPLVVFKINARAFPGHMVVEFRASCPDGTGGILRRKIEYIVSVSGYGCSSTHLPEWFRPSLVFYDDDPKCDAGATPLGRRNLLRDGGAQL